MNVRHPESPAPASEPCFACWQEFGDYQLPGQEGRLFSALRLAAQTKNATEILTRAAIMHIELPPPVTGPLNLAMPLADLAVTGRTAFGDFCSKQPQDAQIQDAVRSRIGNQPGVTQQRIADSVRVVLDRAYSVAWFLRGQSARGSLGWIAVSAEDDPPHRPVNVSATTFPQYDVMLETPGAQGPLLVQTRFVVATAAPPAVRPVVAPQRTCPPVLPDPVLPPNDQIILYVHGSTRASKRLKL